MKLLGTLMAAALLSTSGAAFAESGALNDPQIATVALTAHQIDVDRGKLAQKKTKNDAVKQFADQMVTDHTQGLNEVLALAKKLGVKPEESAVTRSLKAGAKKTAAQLEKLSGVAFDKAYVDAEVDYHKAVIDAVNKVLLPAVKNEEVKQALVATTPTLQGHLVHAQQVQAALATAR